MKKKVVILLSLAIVFGTLWIFRGKVHAQAYQKLFVRVATGAGPGLLYQTPGGPKSHVGIMVMHPSPDVLDNINSTELAKRGYTVLAVNTTFGTDNNLDFDTLLLQVRNAVKYLRNRPEIQKVILLGHSGGGPTMAAYQNIAKYGVSACRGKEKIIECPDSLAGLPPADGLILLDPVLGMGAGSLLVSCELAYENASSSDKDIVYIEGATHVTRPVDPLKYGDTTKTTFDYIDGWLSKPGRF